MIRQLPSVAFWLDAAPLLSDLGLPFKVSRQRPSESPAFNLDEMLHSPQAGWSEVIGLVPVYGDLVAAVLQLYQVYLSFLFGIGYDLLGWMVGLFTHQERMRACGLKLSSHTGGERGLEHRCGHCTASGRLSRLSIQSQLAESQDFGSESAQPFNVKLKRQPG
jgi:hypothetical protein